jgi:formamidopyrimidine-DNA glycosylase
VPELPDVTVYVECLRPRIVGRPLESISIRGLNLLRTFEPPVEAAGGRRVGAVERLGKRIVLAMDEDLFLVIHLMIAGRLRWMDSSARSGAKGAGKIDQARLRFDSGVLTLTEAGTKKRASLHVLRGRDAVDALHRGGLDVLSATPEAFDAALRRENRTLKRALTDPRFFDGIGNAYSDEILHAARLSPFKQTRSLDDREAGALHAACVGMLTDWTDRLRRDFGLTNEFGNASPGRFPGAGEITAFRSDFAVHGRFGKPCSVCAAPIQRIVYAENECNYCPGCQTEGRILADRSLSRLLKSDWPRSLDELEDGT